MEAKLIKFPDGDWVVEVPKNTKGITGSMMQHFASTFGHGYKLSLKNCQAIERGYDLGEIKRKVFSGFDGYPNSFTMAAVEITIEIMMDLMGDKKYSEHHMESACAFGMALEILKNDPHKLSNDDEWKGFIQSLQQTEWNVEIEMVPAMSNNGNVYYGDIPKLDADGCLILKKV